MWGSVHTKSSFALFPFGFIVVYFFLINNCFRLPDNLSGYSAIIIICPEKPMSSAKGFTSAIYVVCKIFDN